MWSAWKTSEPILSNLELLRKQGSGSVQHVPPIRNKIGAAVLRCRCRFVDVRHLQAREIRYLNLRSPQALIAITAIFHYQLFVYFLYAFSFVLFLMFTDGTYSLSDVCTELWVSWFCSWSSITVVLVPGTSGSKWILLVQRRRGGVGAEARTIKEMILGWN